MRSRILPAFLSLLIVFGVMSGRGEGKPNILFLIADDLRPELGCYGSDIAATPHLDALARRGIRFDRAYCQMALCWPSRNSLLSGLMPSQLGEASASLTFRASHPGIPSLPQHFREAGWHVASFGKILHNGQDDPISWSQPHFDPPPLHYALPENQGRHPIINRAVEENNDNPVWEAADVTDEVYEDGLTTNAAITALHRLANAGKPFFLLVGFHKPHSPFVAPRRDWDLYERERIPLPFPSAPPRNAPEKFVFHPSRYLRSFGGFPDEGPVPEDTARTVRHAYFACISYVDRLTGKILAALEESGQRENTLVVFTSDHGYHLGDHGLWSKHTTFEIATRVPLLIAGPGVARDRSSEALVELVDLFPTLSEFAALPAPDHLQGRSFASVLSDPDAETREAAFSEFTRNGARGVSIRSSRFRYTEWRSAKDGTVLARELYDHETDPRESVNAIGDPTLKSLRERAEELLEDRLSEIDSTPEPQPALPVR